MSARTSRPSDRVAKIASIAAVPAAPVGSGLVVGQASYPAYSANTVNPTNDWTTGTVALSDDDSNTAAFNVANLQPGSTASTCIVVTSTGSLASTVKLYGTTPTTTKALSSHINLSISQGTGGSSAGCSGFTALATESSAFDGTLQWFGSTFINFGYGAGAWTPTGTASVSRAFTITSTVSSTAPNSTQAGTAGVGLTWEAQNNN